MKIDEPRAIIFYGDITSFTSWSRRVRTEQVRTLIETTYGIYKRWAKENGLWLKTLGDGFVAVSELTPQNDRGKILRLLRHAALLTAEINSHFSLIPFPRPDGFRMRVPIGDVWKFTSDDGEVDYAGYQMDFGRRMLDMEKNVLYILTEATYDAVGRRSDKKSTIQRIEIGSIDMMGITVEDRRNFYRYDQRRAERRKK